MRVVNYSDFEGAVNKSDNVIFDFKLFDIPSTMRRNIKMCSQLGATAVTIADNPLNQLGIHEALKAGQDYDIGIIIGQHRGA